MNDTQFSRVNWVAFLKCDFEGLHSFSDGRLQVQQHSMEPKLTILLLSQCVLARASTSFSPLLTMQQYYICTSSTSTYIVRLQKQSNMYSTHNISPARRVRHCSFTAAGFSSLHPIPFQLRWLNAKLSPVTKNDSTVCQLPYVHIFESHAYILVG